MSVYDPFTPEELAALEVDDYLMGRNEDLTLLSDSALAILGFKREDNDDPDSGDYSS